MKQPKCVVEPDGTKSWYLNGERHREDGPAYEAVDGTKWWYLNGERHREDGPAYEAVDGTKKWYLNGEEITASPINTHGLKVGDLVFIKSEPAIVIKKTEALIYFFLDEQEVVYVNE
jgi:hypothetical protein